MGTSTGTEPDLPDTGPQTDFYSASNTHTFDFSSETIGPREEPWLSAITGSAKPDFRGPNLPGLHVLGARCLREYLASKSTTPDLWRSLIQQGGDRPSLSSQWRHPVLDSVTTEVESVRGRNGRSNRQNPTWSHRFALAGRPRPSTKVSPMVARLPWWAQVNETGRQQGNHRQNVGR